jgi:hypothetical protein
VVHCSRGGGGTPGLQMQTLFRNRAAGRSRRHRRPHRRGGRWRDSADPVVRSLRRTVDPRGDGHGARHVSSPLRRKGLQENTPSSDGSPERARCLTRAGGAPLRVAIGCCALQCSCDHAGNSGVRGPRLAGGARQQGRLLGGADRTARPARGVPHRGRAASSGPPSRSRLAGRGAAEGGSPGSRAPERLPPPCRFSPPRLSCWRCSRRVLARWGRWCLFGAQAVILQPIEGVDLPAGCCTRRDRVVRVPPSPAGPGGRAGPHAPAPNG